MNSLSNSKKEIISEGFTVIDNILTDDEINQLLQIISEANTSKPNFRTTTDLFAIRQFFKEIPASAKVIFNEKMKSLILNLFGEGFFVVKSIYFDKPDKSNWFVSYHQDLTISVNKKTELNGFGSWTKKQNQFAVQPPLEILQTNFTIRIHLDDTNEENGALKVIPKSHLKGIYRSETINWTVETENICKVKKGGIMIMKPLLLHSSGRTINNRKRRVIHIEFSRSILLEDLKWSELLQIKTSY